MFSRKTKIVCSMGPTTESVDIICSLLKAGMNVARFNFSHSDHTYHKKNMENVRKASEITGIPCALLMDTKGPEIRTGLVPHDGKITIYEGDTFLVTNDDCPVRAAGQNDAKGTQIPGKISLSWKKLPEEIEKDCRILIADGLVELKVLETDKKSVITTVAMNTGTIGSKKNVNIIGIHPNIPVLSEQDKKDIEFGISMGVDFIAASFISSPSDVVSILRFLEPFNTKVKIISKIENEEGVNNIDEIAAVSAGVMVARGDLGVQLPTEQIPLAQKKIIHACNLAGKPVITATQMLDSMIVNPRPTRAELTDVANAILDGTDAVMLSGETANGAHPVEAVTMMDKIARTVEMSEEYEAKIKQYHRIERMTHGIEETMTKAAHDTAAAIEASAILSPTVSGNTARLLSMYRPQQSIIAATPDKTVFRQLLLAWGVIPLHVPIASDSEDMIQNAIGVALEQKLIKISDKLVMVAGVPIISPLYVNTIRVISVGNVLARGLNAGGYCSLKSRCRVTGRVVKAESPEEARINLGKRGGEILVIRNLDMSFVPLLRLVNGLIVENPSEMTKELMTMVNPNLVWISQVSGAMKKFEQGLTITIDSSEKLIYEGIIN